MKKMVSCFECGCKYDRKKSSQCHRCGETRIFEPRLHDENYDLAKDLSRNARVLIVATLILFALVSFMITAGWNSLVIQRRENIHDICFSCFTHIFTFGSRYKFLGYVIKAKDCNCGYGRWRGVYRRSRKAFLCPCKSEVLNQVITQGENTKPPPVN